MAGAVGLLDLVGAGAAREDRGAGRTVDPGLPQGVGEAVAQRVSRQLEAIELSLLEQPGEPVRDMVAIMAAGVGRGLGEELLLSSPALRRHIVQEAEPDQFGMDG